MTLTQVTFNDNEGRIGAGMYIVETSPTMIDVTFSGNTATQSGGGMYVTWSGPTLVNATFTGNQAVLGKGGGIYGYYQSKPTLINVTFSGNQAGEAGGAIYSTSASNPTLVNSILWGNRPDEVSNDEQSSATVTHSNVQLLSGVHPGTGNINQDPLFIAPVAANEAPTTAGNYRLRENSPAIDAGTNHVVTVDKDLGGKPRIVDGTGDGNAVVDMGAHEFQIPIARVYLPLVLTNH